MNVIHSLGVIVLPGDQQGIQGMSRQNYITL